MDIFFDRKVIARGGKGLHPVGVIGLLKAMEAHENIAVFATIVIGDWTHYVKLDYGDYVEDENVIRLRVPGVRDSFDATVPIDLNETSMMVIDDCGEDMGEAHIVNLFASEPRAPFGWGLAKGIHVWTDEMAATIEQHMAKLAN